MSQNRQSFLSTLSWTKHGFKDDDPFQSKACRKPSPSLSTQANLVDGCTRFSQGALGKSCTSSLAQLLLRGLLVWKVRPTTPGVKHPRLPRKWQRDPCCQQASPGGQQQAVQKHSKHSGPTACNIVHHRCSNHDGRKPCPLGRQRRLPQLKEGEGQHHGLPHVVHLPEMVTKRPRAH